MQHERHCEHSDDCAPDFKGNERRTWAVVALTFVVMIGELVAGARAYVDSSSRRKLILVASNHLHHPPEFLGAKIATRRAG